jgi:hypothetical protein
MKTNCPPGENTTTLGTQFPLLCSGQAPPTAPPPPAAAPQGPGPSVEPSPGFHCQAVALLHPH